MNTSDIQKLPFIFKSRRYLLFKKWSRMSGTTNDIYIQCVPARGGTICRRAGSRLPCIFTLYLLCTKMTVQVPFGSHKLLKLVCLSIVEIFTNFVGQVLNKILKNSDRKKFKFYLIPKQRNSPRSPPSLYRPISNPYGNQMGPRR